MNRAEFGRWLDHYRALFPETGEWINRVGETDAAGGGGPARLKAMLEAWGKLLQDVEFRDVMAATEKMFAGDDLEYPALGVHFGDREKTPSHVRRLARRIRFDRKHKEAKARERARQQEERLHGGQTRYRYSMGDLFRSLLQMQREGDTDAVQKMRAMADEAPRPGERGYSVSDGAGELFDHFATQTKEQP
jgi:hypothetical protein